MTGKNSGPPSVDAAARAVAAVDDAPLAGPEAVSGIEADFAPLVSEVTASLESGTMQAVDALRAFAQQHLEVLGASSTGMDGLTAQLVEVLDQDPTLRALLRPPE